MKRAGSRCRHGDSRWWWALWCVPLGLVACDGLETPEDVSGESEDPVFYREVPSDGFQQGNDIPGSGLCEIYSPPLPEPAESNVRCGLSPIKGDRPLGASCTEHDQCMSGYCLEDPLLVARMGRICTAQCSRCNTPISCGQFVDKPWKGVASCLEVNVPLAELPSICVVVCGNSNSGPSSVDCGGLGTACIDNPFLKAGPSTVRTCLPPCDS